MKILSLFVAVLFFAMSPAPAVLALDGASQEISLGLVPFSSDEGMARLARSDAKINFPTLANQFEAEYLGAFCGPASAAMVLNAARGHAVDVPHDKSRLRSEDLKYTPAGADVSVARYTQDNVIERGAKTRAQVLGEPVTINGRTLHDFGYQTRQLDQMLQANGLSTRLVIVDDQKPEADVRADLVQSLRERGHFVIVSFSRKALAEPGFGHISPLGAYDAASDSFLMLDVNPTRVDWMWVPARALIAAMRTFDTIETVVIFWFSNNKVAIPANIIRDDNSWRRQNYGVFHVQLTGQASATRSIQDYLSITTHLIATYHGGLPQVRYITLR